MQTKESLRFGLRLTGVLDLLDVEKIGNPWRDEYGMFTDEANAVFNVNAKLPPEELEAHHQAYLKQNKDGFVHYTPKALIPKDAPPRWQALNRAVGKAEGVANAYMGRYFKTGKPTSPDGKKIKAYWIANASALRDMASILAQKRDNIGAKVKKGSDLFAQVVLKEDDLPGYIAEAFAILDSETGPDGGEFEPDQAKRAKTYIVNNAVLVGLLSREEGNRIIALLE